MPFARPSARPLEHSRQIFFGANLIAFALAIFLIGLLSIVFRLEKTAYR